MKRGEAGERPHLSLEPPQGGETWHVKGNDVTNVEWEPETRVLSFSLTKQAQRGIINRTWRTWTAGWQTWARPLADRGTDRGPVKLLLCLPNAQATRDGPAALEALGLAAAGSMAGPAGQAGAARPARQRVTGAIPEGSQGDPVEDGEPACQPAGLPRIR